METSHHIEAPQLANKEITDVDLDDIKGNSHAAQEAAMDAALARLEEQSQGVKRPKLEVSFSSPAVFTWVLVGFASLGGLLSGLDQSLISGANLYMPKDLSLSSNQASLANSGMPLGAVAGA